MSDATAERVVRIHEKMKSDRKNWDTHWREIAEYIIPRKNDVFGATRGSDVRGEKKGIQLYNSIGQHTNELLASALHGMLTNPAGVWFGLSTGDKELDNQKEVREWLQTSVNRMIQVMNNSNFQTEVHEIYIDLGSFGTSLMRVEEDEDFVVRFQARPIYEAYIAENFKGSIDTVSYEYIKTLRQIVQEFGEESLNDQMRQMFQKDPMKRMHVIHLVQPREDFDPNKKSKTNLPFASFHVVKDQRVLLKEDGFNENPYIVTRWSKISGEIYGRSPGMKALPDIKMANEMQRVVIVGAQKVIDPSVQAPDDGVLLPIRLIPGGINYYRAGTKDRIEPINTGSRPDIGEQMIATVEERVRQAYFIDQLNIREADRMTATEVIQRREEQLRMLGPILGRQNFEFLRPLVERVFSIMDRKNMLPPAPSAIQGLNLEVKYTSQIAKAQETSDADDLTRVFGLLTPLAQARPEMLDNFDADEIARGVSNKFNLPAEYLTSEDEVAATRQAKAEAVQQQQEADQLQGALGTAEQLQNLEG